MLAYRVSTQEITGMAIASMVIGWELYLCCELVVRTPPNKEHPRTNYMTDLVEWLHNIHHYAQQQNEGLCMIPGRSLSLSVLPDLEM
jgi:hypothetical protein